MFFADTAVAYYDFFVNIEFYFNYYYNQIWEYLSDSRFRIFLFKSEYLE